MPRLPLSLLPCLLFILALLAGCNAGSAPPPADAEAQPRQSSQDKRHFWRKREIEEISRRIIEKELGYQDALRLADAENGDAGGRYRFRLASAERTRLGQPKEDIAFVVQADLANGRIISIHCRQRDGSSHPCYPNRNAAWS